MNREIRFRAWDGTSNHMITPDLINDWEDFFILPDGSVQQSYEDNRNTYEPYRTLRSLPHYILMQFTGLLDKNGKEIYEGDIVELTAQLPITRCKVEWKECGFVLTGIIPWQNKRVEFSEDQLNKRWENNYIEIIGNIYENPSLIP